MLDPNHGMRDWPHKLRELVWSAHHGTISEVGLAELEALLQGNPQIRQQYVDYLRLLADLQFDMVWRSEDLPSIEERHVVPHRRFGHASRLIGLAASLMLIGYFATVAGLLIWDRVHRWHNDLQATTDPPEQIFAQLAHGDDVKWITTDGQSKKRILEVHSGLAEVKFGQGTKVIVEGPAEFEVSSANAGFLRRGKLVAHVPREATGFTIATPTAEVIDLGTEFGVEVGMAGETDIAVFQGKVDVHPRDSAYIAIEQQLVEGRQRLVAGQSSVVALTADKARSRSMATFASLLGHPRAKDLLLVNANEQRIIASDVKQGVRGRPGIWKGTMGMDFDVLAPLEIHRLGVFDSESDGIDPSSQPTVEIWSRDVSGTPIDPSDDRPGRRLAYQEFSAESPGQLVGGNRFKPLDTPLRLEHGSYTILAWGFNWANASARLGYGDNTEPLPPDTSPDQPINLHENWLLNDGGGRILFFPLARISPEVGAFSSKLNSGTEPSRFLAGTFEFIPVVKSRDDAKQAVEQNSP